MFLDTLIQFGYAGLFLAIFAETGLLIGFFLPGDSLLFTAGILAAAGKFNIWLVLGLAFAAAVLGDSTGYYLGRRYGRGIFSRKDSRFLSPERVHDAEDFFAKHGKSSIVIARFAPFVRTVISVLAGIGEMHYQTFVTFNIIGGFLWAVGMSLVGYFLGMAVPNVENYLTLILGIIVILSLLPYIFGLLKKILQKNNKKDPRRGP